MSKASVLLFVCLTMIAGEKVSVHSLIELSKNPRSPQFQEALLSTLKDEDIKKGTGWIAEGPDFVWAIESANQPTLFVDNNARPAMKQIPGAKLWYAVGQVTPVGKLHSFHYVIDGQKFGGRIDLPAHPPESYAHPGVPQGKLSEKLVLTSKIYEGMVSEYWVYVPAQYDPRTAAALMVWQDGQSYIDRDLPTRRVLNVVDNLIHQKKIPVMICVFISPGDITNAPNTETYRFVQAYSERWKRTLPDSMRSVEYDTVSDRYARFLRDELLAQVQSKYKIRTDGYSRGITGLSSGGICAFNAAWQQPDQFSRVISWIGSFAGIQWHPGLIDGGNVFPNKVRTEPKRNIRVWLQDGSEDLENQYGSWPLQNVQLANSLKMREYDFHFSFGHGTHSSAHGSAEFGEEMTWLWRDYDPSRTEQVYEMDAQEKARPLFRIQSLNR